MQQDHDYLMIAEEVVGLDVGGWTEEDIQAAADIKLPMDLRREDVEPLDEILNEYPDLQQVAQKIAQEPLAQGTMGNYKGVLKKFKLFCYEHKGYDYGKITEKALLHFITLQVKQGAGFAYLCKLKPALVLLLEMQTGRSEAFTERVSRWLAGAKRLAAKKRGPTKKAKEVKLELLQGMVSKYVTPHVGNISGVDVFKFRTIVRLVVEYFTFCRFSDYQKLRAKHLELVGGDILVTFPSSKNDQYHNGQSTLLKENGTDFCPVRLIKLYYKRFGWQFGAASRDEAYLFCMMRKSGGLRYGDGKHVASASKAREELQQLMKEMGGDGAGVTDKSFKMLGVTKSLEAGLTVEEAALHGRWRTTTMPLTYKHNSMEYKAGVAEKIPH